MQKFKEHIRQCFFNYYKLELNASKVKQKTCQAIGKDAAPTKIAYLWFERFRNVDFSLEDDE